jgi:hypothetical protein
VDFKQLHHPTVFNPSITLNPERCVNLNNKVNEIVPVKYRNTDENAQQPDSPPI